MLTGPLLLHSMAKHARGNSHLRLTLLLVSAGFLLFSQSTYALDPAKELSQYGQTAWRLQEGALPGAPAAIAQTKDGYIWIGTQAGLLRFDGVRFSAWSPPPGTAAHRCIGNGHVAAWRQRRQSLDRNASPGCPDGKTTRSRIMASRSPRSSRSSRIATARIWVTRSRVRDLSGPLCEVSGNDLRCYGTKDGIPVNAADPIFQDPEGNLWVGGNGSLIRWNNRVPTVYPLQTAKTSDDSRIDQRRRVHDRYRNLDRHIKRRARSAGCSSSRQEDGNLLRGEGWTVQNSKSSRCSWIAIRPCGWEPRTMGSTESMEMPSTTSGAVTGCPAIPCKRSLRIARAMSGWQPPADWTFSATSRSPRSAFATA